MKALPQTLPLGTDRATARGRLAVEALAALEAGLATLLVAPAAFLAARRLLGALREPLPVALLLAVGGAAAAIATMLGLCEWRWPAWHARLARRSGCVALAALGIALSLPGTPLVALALFWGTIVVGEGVAWQLGQRRREGPVRPGSPRVLWLDPKADTPRIVQQFTRAVSAAGVDEFRGQIHADFDPGQRTAYVHVAFCPPFAGLPRCELTQVDGPAARVKMGSVLTWGARVEIKLETAGPAQVRVELRATNSASHNLPT